MAEVFWDDIQRLFERPRQFFEVERNHRQALLAVTYSCLMVIGAGVMMQLMFAMAPKVANQKGPLLLGGWIMNNGWISTIGAAVLFVMLLLYALLVKLALLVAKRPAPYWTVYSVVSYAFIPLVFSLLIPFAFLFALPYSMWLCVQGIRKRFALELGSACGVAITPLVPALLLPAIALVAAIAFMVMRALG